MSTHLNKVEYKEVESTNELECRPLMGMKHQWAWKMQTVKKLNKHFRKGRAYNHGVGYLSNWF